LIACSQLWPDINVINITAAAEAKAEAKAEE